MNDGKRELKRCPICGSLPRYWQWNHGAIVECWCKDHRIQCEGKTLEEAVKAWERRADVVEVVRCADCKYWDRSVLEHQANDFREWDEAECGMLAERDPYHETDHYTEEDDFCSRGERKDG